MRQALVIKEQCQIVDRPRWRRRRLLALGVGLASLVISAAVMPASAVAAPRSQVKGARVGRSWLGRKRLVIGSMKMPLSSQAASMVEKALAEPNVHRRLVKALQALRLHDAHTFEHSRRVGAYARLVARELGFGVAPEVGLAGALHDIGKLGVRRRLLQGKNAKLSERQFAEIKRHPAYGATLLRALGADMQTVSGALSHHERLDGRGYPEALAGDGVPTIGRILAVVDAFDAMTSTRSYNKPMTKAQGIARLRELAGKTLDATVVEAFVRALQTRAGRKVFAACQRRTSSR